MKCPKCKKGEMLIFFHGAGPTCSIGNYYRCWNCNYIIEDKDKEN